ncbi:phosphoglucomutase [Streptococcus pneumoniae]|nr:phosphoglucomutase [Streptococcus pneumoniae]CWF56458.1 phosphoglucomutase [Streptococcus pneumoniae]VKP95206.1 phosphoglucomutase [Streptococcus pneumoniae]VOR33885.1 phosphoglucomutase [Streptococcus pneumoniae]VPY22753.1 phosphoglucomutase [Streptococcus pneumoniae]
MSYQENYQKWVDFVELPDYLRQDSVFDDSLFPLYVFLFTSFFSHVKRVLTPTPKNLAASTWLCPSLMESNARCLKSVLYAIALL